MLPLKSDYRADGLPSHKAVGRSGVEAFRREHLLYLLESGLRRRLRRLGADIRAHCRLRRQYEQKDYECGAQGDVAERSSERSLH